MSLPPELSHWLSSVCQQHYPHAGSVYAQVAHTLINNPQLRPRTRVYTGDDGNSTLLLQLHGSLPAIIKNNRYNIPVELWIPIQYPNIAPFAYVVPTTQMLLNPGNHVDANGRCYLPYLAHWDNQTSTLVQLCNELSSVFALKSPVYARPKSVQSNSTPSPSPKPALPPKPQVISHIQSPPPIPPIPQNIRLQQQQHHQQQQQHQHQYQHQNLSPQQSRPVSFQQPDFMDSQISTSPNNDIKRQQVLQQLLIILQSLQKNIIEKQIDQFTQNTSQIQQSIQQFDKIFDFETKQLDSLRQPIDKNKLILEDTIKETHDTISTIKSTAKPHPDETIIAESIPEAQLYELVTQDLAINDTLTALNTAFSQGKIPLTSLLKYSRQLSREQFEKRSLIRKISKELGIQV